MRRYQFFLYCTSLSFIASVQAAQQIPAIILQAKSPQTPLTQQNLLSSSHKIHYSTLNSLLGQLWGVQTLSYENTTTLPLSLRGFAANASQNHILLIDGQPLLAANLTLEDLSFWSSTDLQNLSSLPGSSSVLYGDEAVGGVIKLQLPPQIKPQQNIFVNLGHYERQHIGLRLARRSNNQRLGYAMGVNVLHDQHYREHQRQQQHNILLATDYYSQHLNWQLKYYVNDQIMQYPGALTEAQALDNPRQALQHQNYFKQQQQLLLLNHHLRFSEKVHLEVKSQWHEQQGHGLLKIPYTSMGQFVFLQPSLYIASSSQSHIFGIALQSMDYHFNTMQQQQKQYAFFHQWRFKMPSQMHFQLGLAQSFCNSARSYSPTSTHSC